MRKPWLLVQLVAIYLFMSCVSPAFAQCPTFYPLSNGYVADATQVMSNFDYIIQCPVFTGTISTPNVILTSGSGFYEINTIGSGYAYIWSPSSSVWSLGYNSISASPANPTLSWNTSGNVGIGTISPSKPLEVYGAGNGQLRVTGGVGNVGIEMVTATSGFYNWQIGAQNELYNGFSITPSTTTSGTTFTTPVVSVFASGNVGIDTTSPSYTLHINGSVAAITYVNLSDARLKKDIVPIGDALALIASLHGVRFQWRTQQERTVGRDFKLPVGEPQVGFVAQDVQKTLPEAVSVGKDSSAIMSVAESKIVPVLVEALKELKVKNDMQAAEIKGMQAQIMALMRKTGTRTAVN